MLRPYCGANGASYALSVGGYRIYGCSLRGSARCRGGCLSSEVSAQPIPAVSTPVAAVPELCPNTFLYHGMTGLTT